MAISILIPQVSAGDFVSFSQFAYPNSKTKQSITSKTTFDDAKIEQALPVDVGTASASLDLDGEKNNAFALTKNSRVMESTGQGREYWTSSPVKSGDLSSYYRDKARHTVFIKDSADSSYLVCFSYGELVTFPCQQEGIFSPAELDADVTYNNNISGMGQFIGRSVVRESFKASLKPVSFTANQSRLDDVMEVLDVLRRGPTFFKVDGPGETVWVWYGWTESEPSVIYTGELDRMEISLNLRVI